METLPVPPIPGFPQSIADYTFGCVIGQGSSSIVRLTYDSTGRQYATKIMPKHNLEKQGLLARFENEVRIVQQLHHPGIVQLFDLLQDSTNYYLIMELCSKGPLFRYIIENQRLEELEARYFLRQVLEALDYVHSLGVVHRDLKPENLLLGDDGHIKITDFGLSRFVNATGIASTPCGSLCYAAPECIRGEPYDGRKADAWSCGVIAFAMLTGQLPWTKRNQTALFEQICRGDFDIPTYISPLAADFIRRMMAPEVNQRLSVAQALQHAWIKGAPEYRKYREFRDLGQQRGVISLRQLDRFFGRDNPELSIEAEVKHIAQSGSINCRTIEDTLRALNESGEHPGTQKKVNKTARATAQRILYRSQPTGLTTRPKRPPSSKMWRL